MSKIIFYVNQLYEGGAERVMANLANQFSENGVDVILITSFAHKGEYTLSEKVTRYTLEQMEVKSNFLKRNISRICKLRKIIRKEKPDAVISFMAEPNFRALLATVGTGVATVISVRNDPNREYASKAFRCLAKILFRRAEGVVFQTVDAQAWFPKKIQCKSTIIMNQVAEEFFAAEPSGEEYFVAVGRLQAQKNIPMLIRAFSRFLKEFPNEQLYIYGAGSEEEKIQAMIDSCEITKNVHLMGITADVPGVLAKAKCFVMTSDYEGLPNSLLEAMAVGLPCISTDCPCGGPRMVIDHEKNGILVPVGDEDALYEALCQMEDKATRKKYGEKAKQTAQGFCPEIVFGKWQSYVSKIINDSRHI